MSVDILIQRYEKVRSFGMKLNPALLKTISRETIEKGASLLGLFENKKMVFRNQHEMKILADFTIYHIRTEGKNAIENYLTSYKDALSLDETELLNVLQKAVFCILEVKEHIAFGKMKVKDLISQKEYLFVDKAMSMTGTPGVVIVTNLIFFDDFAMTTGGPIPLVDPHLAHQVTGLAKKVKPTSEKAVANILKLCLDADALSKVVYC